jgi:hypothetical protein
MTVRNDQRPVGNVYDLDDLIPKDIGLRFSGTEYRVPADLPIDTTYALFELFANMIEAQQEAVAGDGGNADRATTAVKDLEQYVLGLFQIRQPKLPELPFGVAGLLAVVRVILIELGAISAETPEREAPERPLASRTPKRATSVKKPASRRSASSRR